MESKTYVRKQTSKFVEMEAGLDSDESDSSDSSSEEDEYNYDDGFLVPDDEIEEEHHPPRKASLEDEIQFERRRVSVKLTNGLMITGFFYACRIHQGGRRKRKAGKKSFLPMLIYSFATYGPQATFKKYNFDATNVSFKDTDTPADTSRCLYSYSVHGPLHWSYLGTNKVT